MLFQPCSNLRNTIQWNRKRNSYISIQENAFENVVCETAVLLCRGGGDELSVTTTPPLPMVHSILSVSVNQPDRTLGNTFYRLALDALHNKNLFPFKFLENKIFTWKGWKGVDVSKLQRLEYKYAQGIRVPPCISHERSKYMSRALFWGPFY